MTNPSRAKGSLFAKQVAECIATNSQWLAERRVDGGSKDRGDIAGTPLVWECKNTKSIDLATAVDEALKEAANDGADFGVAVIKRRLRPVGQAYCVMPLNEFIDLLRMAY